MNSKFNELKKFSENKYLTSSMCRSVTINSIKELLKSETGRVYTGTCYVKPIKLKHGIVAEHFRDVWTDEVAEVLDRFEIMGGRKMFSFPLFPIHLFPILRYPASGGLHGFSVVKFPGSYSDIQLNDPFRV